eukprot:1650025-Rhodomonas_salina.1
MHRAGGSGPMEQHIACCHSRRSAVNLTCQQQHINGGAHFGATCRRRWGRSSTQAAFFTIGLDQQGETRGGVFSSS